MARIRVSTTVDGDLLAEARAKCQAANDAALLDAALTALLASRRSAEIDAAYAKAHSEDPIDQPDEWGDLASFNEAAGRS